MKYKFGLDIHSSIRIIGGKWKRRRIYVTNHGNVRPTVNVMRETLFNWLNNVICNSICLDCFAGSGALGLEALSRGAHKVTFLERNLICVKVLLQTIRSFKDTCNSEVIHTNSLYWIKKLNTVYNIVFIDPPFAEDLVSKIIFLLEKYNCLYKKSWIYIEIPRYRNILTKDLILPYYWILYRVKIMKTAKYCLYLRNL